MARKSPSMWRHVNHFIFSPWETKKNARMHCALSVSRSFDRWHIEILFEFPGDNQLEVKCHRIPSNFTDLFSKENLLGNEKRQWESFPIIVVIAGWWESSSQVYSTEKRKMRPVVTKADQRTNMDFKFSANFSSNRYACFLFIRPVSRFPRKPENQPFHSWMRII